MGRARLAAAVLVVWMLVIGSAMFLAPVNCYSSGYGGPMWVYEDHGQQGGGYCDAHWWEYLLPWHWGAEDVCISMCLEGT